MFEHQKNIIILKNKLLNPRYINLNFILWVMPCIVFVAMICNRINFFLYLSFRHWIFIFLLLLLVAGVYFLIKKIENSFQRAVIVFCSYLSIAFIIFYPTIFNIFRSDYWLFKTLFHDAQGHLSFETLKFIALFELFGHPRFMPFANLFMYFENIILGNNIVFYHITNLVFHVVNSYLIFLFLYNITRELRYSYIFGAFFICLPSQCDMVAWEYHTFLLFSSIIILSSFLFVIRFNMFDKLPHLFISFVLMLFSLFFYEPHAIGLCVLLFMICGKYHSYSWTIFKQRLIISKRELIYIFALFALCYITYYFVFEYVMALTREKHLLSLPYIFSWKNNLAAINVVFINLWESTFLKNIGVHPFVDIGDIVYVFLTRNPFVNFTNIINLILGFILVSLFRIRRENGYIVVSLIIFIFFYLFIISAGRMHSSPGAWYITSQPRYQYFPNVIAVLLAGLLLFTKYKQEKLKPLIALILISFIFWNSLTTMDSNRKLAKAMNPMDTYYYEIKDFIRDKPNARIFLDFIPSNYDSTWGEVPSKFFLGTDIALDLLLKDKVTKFIERATHIYDGHFFKNNNLYQKGKGNPYLKNFTVEWMYWCPPDVPPRKSVAFLGSDRIYPKISVTPENFVEVALKQSNTDKIDVYRLETPYDAFFEKKYRGRLTGSWTSIVLEKDGDELFLIMNGILHTKIKLKHMRYEQWSVDGVDLFGPYYRGIGEAVFITRLFKQLDHAKYKCSNYSIGDFIGVDIKIPY